VSALAFDLTHRADLLVRLGRPEEANRVLDEIDAGIAKGVDAYIARARRASLVRALAATCAQRFDVAGREAAAVNSGSAQQDSTAMFAAALLTNAEARLGRRAAHALPAIAGRSRELRYWEISARLAAGDARGAADAVVAELTQPQPSYELEWRLAALGAAAARRARLDDTAQGLERRALEALQRLRNAWREHARSYEMRPDVAQLLRDASLKTVMKGN
jgi:hypothetical protein